MGPIVSRVVVSGLPIDEAFLDALTAIVLIGTTSETATPKSDPVPGIEHR